MGDSVLSNGEHTWAGVDVGPALPMQIYTCTEAWHPERIGAMAVYCSDGRWGEAFDEFCHKRLHIPRYDRWAVPGGPAWLAPAVVGGPAYEATPPNSISSSVCTSWSASCSSRISAVRFIVSC